MKVFILFRLKDTASKKKEYVVDNLYTDILCVTNRINKLLRRDKKQDFYYITKSIRGRFKLQANKVEFVGENKVKIHCSNVKL